MKSAKEYYYEYYAQNSGIENLQSTINLETLGMIHPSLKKEKYLREIQEYKLKYSNDIRLDTIFQEILNCSNNELKSILKNVFISTYIDPKLQANIKEYPGGFEGSIIFFNIGILHALLDYSILLTYVLHYFSGFKNKKKPFLRGRIIILAKKLAKHQNLARQHKEYPYGCYEDEFKKLPTKLLHGHTVPFQSALKFILCHEIAHSVLGHHFGSDKFLSKYCGIKWTDIAESSYQHQKEFNADIFSLLLSAGCYHKSNNRFPFKFEFEVEQILGSLLVFTVLGQQQENVNMDSASHPSIDKRFGIMINTLKKGIKESVFNGGLRIMFEFISLLYKTQKVGLGKNPKINKYNTLRIRNLQNIK